MEDAPIDLEVCLVDLTGLALSDLRVAGQAPLDNALRRIIDEQAGDQQTVVSGFESSI